MNKDLQQFSENEIEQFQNVIDKAKENERKTSIHRMKKSEVNPDLAKRFSNFLEDNNLATIQKVSSDSNMHVITLNEYGINFNPKEEYQLNKDQQRIASRKETGSRMRANMAIVISVVVPLSVACFNYFSNEKQDDKVENMLDLLNEKVDTYKLQIDSLKADQKTISYEEASKYLKNSTSPTSVDTLMKK